MSNGSQSNKDLVWDLDTFRHQSVAAQFVKRFENKLCVYSGSVEQLYTNYTIYFPEDEGRKMVILPDPYSYHDTFQGVPEKAIQTTGLSIVPGEIVGKVGLFLVIPVKSAEGKKARIVPLHAGLSAINNARPKEKPLLPVVMKGDLREMKRRLPALHLHCIHLDRLDNRSALERSGIQKVISEKLPTIS